MREPPHDVADVIIVSSGSRPGSITPTSLSIIHFSTVPNDSDTARFFRKLPQRPSNALFIPEGRRHNPVHGIYEAQLSRNEAVAIYSGTAAWSPSLPPPGTKPPLHLRPSRPRQIFFPQLSTKIGKNFPTERNFPPNTHAHPRTGRFERSSDATRTASFANPQLTNCRAVTAVRF